MKSILSRFAKHPLWRIGVGVSLLVTAVCAQTVTLIPTCGKPGDKVCISGSGWAEPNPLCRYIFTMDGASLAADQQDGLYGPPATNGTVPALPDGNHTVLVQLVLDDASSTLVQQQTSPFKVLSAQQNPWTTASGAGGTMNITFDPTNVCAVGPCTKIVFVQVIQQLGVKADGTTTNLTFAQQGFANAATLDKDVVNGQTVDYLVGEADPYYNGDDASDIGTQGAQGATPKAATMNDTPNRTDASYPAGIVSIRLQFEVDAFCAAGASAGQYYGRLLWTWERAKGAAGTKGTISGISTDQNQPSAGATAALNLWATNHGFTVPAAQPSPCIY
jgi:hypothetical protein